MGIESWMITVFGAVLTFIVGIAVLRAKVVRLASDLREHIDGNKSDKDKTHTRIDAGFKRLDTLSDDVIILKRDTSTHMDLPTAEQRFVTKEVLGLHLEKLEIVTDNTNKRVEDTNKQVTMVMGKLDEVLSVLSGDAK